MDSKERLEQELLREKEKVKRLQEHIFSLEQKESYSNFLPDIFLTVDSNFNIINFNSNAHFRSIVPRGLSHIDELQMSDVNRAKLQERTKKAMKTFSEFEMEMGFKCLPNIIFRLKIIPKDESEVVYIFRDISQQKKDEQKLSEMHSRLFLAATATKVGVFDWDILEDIVHFEVPVYEILKTMSFGGARGMDLLWNVIAEEDIKKVKRIFFIAFREGSNFEIDFHIKWPNNEIRLINCSFTVYRNKNNKPKRIIGVLQDVTEKYKEIELKKIREYEKELEEFKNNFIANISHEIRTPLNGILGSIQVLGNDSDEAEKISNHISTIKQSSDDLLEKFNNVLDANQLNTGKISLLKEPFIFHDAVIEAVHTHSVNARKKGLDFYLRIDEEVPQRIMGDSKRLTQVISNLASNAVKFTREGGISIEISSEQLPNFKHKIKCVVSDSGIGIQKKSQEKIFDSCTQTDSSYTKNSDGVGLGLTISKKLVQLFKGQIGFQSEKGEGSQFWFTVILEEDKEISKKASYDVFSGPTIKSAELPPLNILVVEDKKINQKVLKLMLLKGHHQVVLADNGKEAIERFQEGFFDIILMDIQMPVMDGLTASRILKTEFENCPPIIAVSANSAEQNRKNEYLDGFIPKPATIEMLNRSMAKFVKF